MFTLPKPTLNLFYILFFVALAGCNSQSEFPNSENNAVSDIEAVDTIPGFGITPKNAMRDDTIALWEAYQRESIVQQCMQSAQLTYDIEVAFPAGVAINVADSLDLPDAHSLKHSGKSLGTIASVSATNHQRAMDLAETEQDRYFQTLFGESAADVALVESTGVLPPGRADFARGGCVAQSWNEIPGVYALKRALNSDISQSRSLEMSNALLSKEQSAACNTNSEKNSVAINSLATLEQSLAQNENIDIDPICEKALVQLSRDIHQNSIQRTLNENAEMTRSHVSQYHNAMNSISDDSQFMAFMASSTHGLAAEEILDKALDRDE